MSRTVIVAGEAVPAADFFNLCEHGREVANVVGLRAARDIIRIALDRSGNGRRGTGSLYVPKTIEAAAHLSGLIGKDAAMALIEALPCAILNFSRGQELRRRRDSQVAQMLRRGLDAYQVAELIGISDVQVRDIARANDIVRARKQHRQSTKTRVARGRKIMTGRIEAGGLPAYVLRRAEACPIYRRALADVAARHGLRLPDEL